MDLETLRIFNSAASAGSFLKAAKNCSTTQPNVSKLVSMLEKELGVALFERLPRGVKLTEAGSHFLEGSTDVVFRADKLFEETKEYALSSMETVRVGYLENMNLEEILPGFFLSILSESNSKVTVKLVPLKTMHGFELEKNDAVGCFLLPNTHQICSQSLKKRPLTRHFPKVYYSDNYPMARRRKLTVEDFKNATFYRPTDGLDLSQPFKALPYIPRRVEDVPSESIAIRNIEKGDGVGIFFPGIGKGSSSHLHEAEMETDLQVGIDLVYDESQKGMATLLSLLDSYLQSRS